MTLSERLRLWKGSTMTVAIAAQEAADALDAQAERIKALEGALETLVDHFEAYRGGWIGGDKSKWRDRIGLPNDLDKARALLGEK